MTTSSDCVHTKTLFLGTALWGWGVDKATAYAMLELFISTGGRYIDTATNYPINTCPESFGLAIKWLADWVAVNGTSTLSILVKMGAVDNRGNAATDLSSKSILQTTRTCQQRLGHSLSAISVHWDNRNTQEHTPAIKETVRTLAQLHTEGLHIGLSGIQCPALYLEAAPELAETWWIQVKETLVSNAPRVAYERSFPKAHYLAYGINMGGLKREQTSSVPSSLSLRGITPSETLVHKLSAFLDSDHGLCPCPTNFNELALMAMYTNTALGGVILGPRNVEQLNSSLLFWKELTSNNSLSNPNIQNILF